MYGKRCWRWRQHSRKNLVLGTESTRVAPLNTQKRNCAILLSGSSKFLNLIAFTRPKAYFQLILKYSSGVNMKAKAGGAFHGCCRWVKNIFFLRSARWINQVVYLNSFHYSLFRWQAKMRLARLNQIPVVDSLGWLLHLSPRFRCKCGVLRSRKCELQPGMPGGGGTRRHGRECFGYHATKIC